MIFQRSLEIRENGTLPTGAADDSRLGFDAVHWLILTIALLMVAVAAVLCARRVVGALQRPLSLSALIAVGLLLALSVVAVRMLWHRGLATSAQNQSKWLNRLVGYCPTATILCVGLALSLNNTPKAYLAAFWAILFTGESLSRFPDAWRATSSIRKIAKKFISRDRSHWTAPMVVSGPSATYDELELREDVTQHLTHSRAEDGSQAISGRIRVGFEPGQRIANVHLAFCPPFERTPTFDVSQLSGPRGRTKTVQLLPYGVRFDLKLSEIYPDPTEVTLEFISSSQRPVD